MEISTKKPYTLAQVKEVLPSFGFTQEDIEEFIEDWEADDDENDVIDPFPFLDHDNHVTITLH